MNKKIAIFCPTRGRPDRFVEAYESLYKNASHWDMDNIVMFAYLDEDDPKLDDYLDYWYECKRTPYRWVRVEGRRLYPAKTLQHLYDYWGKHSDIFFIGQDDTICRTKNWDIIVREEMPDDLIGVLAAKDVIINGKRRENSQIFFGKTFVELLGYVTPAGLIHAGFDVHLVNIAAGLGCFKEIPVLMEHMHHKYGKSKIDQTYEDYTFCIKEHDSRIIREMKPTVNKIVKRMNSLKQSRPGEMKKDKPR